MCRPSSIWTGNRMHWPLSNTVLASLSATYWSTLVLSKAHTCVPSGTRVTLHVYQSPLLTADLESPQRLPIHIPKRRMTIELRFNWPCNLESQAQRRVECTPARLTMLERVCSSLGLLR